MKLHLSALILLIAPLIASAAPDEPVVDAMAKQTKLPREEIRKHYDSCDSGITLQMNICAMYRWQVQDNRLNKVYSEARAAASKRGYEAALVRSQRAWVAYRDTFCTFEGKVGAGGGTAEGMHVAACKEALTKQQADRLETAVRQP